jgi:hypothetical protein
MRPGQGVTSSFRPEQCTHRLSRFPVSQHHGFPSPIRFHTRTHTRTQHISQMIVELTMMFITLFTMTGLTFAILGKDK